MIQCEHCKRVMGTIHESEELEVRGEVTLILFCLFCKTNNEITLYEYNKNRMKNKK